MIDPAGVRRLLVRAPNWIGDLVMATPALGAIRRRFEGAQIVVMARGAVAEVCAGQRWADRVVRYDPRGDHRTLRARRALAAGLRKVRFDLAVLFPRSFGAALWGVAVAARRRLGHGGDARGWLLTDRLPRIDSRARRHHVEMFFDLARALGAGGAPGPLEYDLGEEARGEASRLLQGVEAPRVAIHPGASKRPRGWHTERWRELAGRLGREWGASVIVLGGGAEAEDAAAIAQAAGSRGASLAGKVTLGGSAALLQASDLLIANDSGAMHLAAAVGTPVIAIFGPGSPDLTGPWMERGRFEALTHRFPCSPCRQRFFEECDPAPSGKPQCIETVTVEEVWEACARLRARTRLG
jgi:lipopolysaccharide heptosyltransferase II